jgi:hypothetical protein
VLLSGGPALYHHQRHLFLRHHHPRPAQHHSTSIATLRTKARPKHKCSTTKTTPRRPVLKWAVVSWVSDDLCLSFFPLFFDCGDAELRNFLTGFSVKGSAERTSPCMGGMSFCEADAEVVRRGPALACGCADVAPAFFFLTRSTWCVALCPCPSSLVQHAPHTAFHVELAEKAEEWHFGCLAKRRYMHSSLREFLFFPPSSLRAVYPMPSPVVGHRCPSLARWTLDE